MISKSHPDNFSSLRLKSSIIKAVTQTQFENCVTAFIALDFKLRREKLSGGDFEIISLFEGYLLMTVYPTHNCLDQLWGGHKTLEFGFKIDYT